MNYDLTLKEDRRKFIVRANKLLKSQRDNVSLVDESNRTLNQNSYLHVLCRILAQDIGTSEKYAKQVYFKELSNSELFCRVTKDPLTGEMLRTVRSTSELTIPEMSQAIDNFILWAADKGYRLPEATVNADGSMTFKTNDDKLAFHQAEILTSRNDRI